MGGYQENFQLTILYAYCIFYFLDKLLEWQVSFF